MKSLNMYFARKRQDFMHLEVINNIAIMSFADMHTDTVFNKAHFIRETLYVGGLTSRKQYPMGEYYYNRINMLLWEKR